MQRTMPHPAKSKADIHREVARRLAAGEPGATVTSVRRAYGLTREEFRALPSGIAPKSSKSPKSSKPSPKEHARSGGSSPRKAPSTGTRKPSTSANATRKPSGTRNNPYTGSNAHKLAQDRVMTTGKPAWYKCSLGLVQVLPPEPPSPRARA